MKKPVESIVPAVTGFKDHVTAVLERPLTDAVNCCVPIVPSVTASGETLITTGGGVKLTVAVPVLVPSATLVAVTVTVCKVVTVAGAEYSPVAVILPAPAGLKLQFTAVLANPLTLAENCCDCPPPRLTVAGVKIMVIGGGFKVIVAEADFDVSATLVAVTVTICCAVMVAGLV